MIAGRADVRVVSVSSLARYIAKIFGRDKNFIRLGVRGEISNYKPQLSGNAYFDLKDRDALLSCVAFSEAAASFPELANGDQVVAYGTVQTFEKKSTYQLRVFQIVAEGGSGVLHQRYEALKARLSAEGLFAQERHRTLPRFPFRVALITSRNAEGARDFITQARARAPHVELRILDTPVQGANAAPEIARAIARAGAMRDIDLIVLARGGGSFEDLFAFSDERVVRALANARTPTVSAIGHEADAPLTDFVADWRAATPSAAAQTVLPRRADLLALIAERRRVLERDIDRAVAARRQATDVARGQLTFAARGRVANLRARLASLERRLAAAAPAVRLAQRRARFEEYRDRLGRAVPALFRRREERVAGVAARLRRVDPGPRIARARAAAAVAGGRLDGALLRAIERKRAALGTQGAKLDGNDPEAILQRGYAIVLDESGRPVRDAEAAPPGSLITAQLARGRLTARVEREGTDGGRQIDLF